MRQEVDLHILLHPICGIGGPADTAKDTAINSRSPQLSYAYPRSSPQYQHERYTCARTQPREGTRTSMNIGVARSLSNHKWKRAGLVGSTVYPVRCSLFTGRLAYTEYMAEHIPGTPRRGDGWYGVAVKRRRWVARQRTSLLREILPRIHQQYYGAIGSDGMGWGGVGCPSMATVAKVWWSAISQGGGGREPLPKQPTRERKGGRGGGSRAITSCALGDSAGGSRDNYMRVPVPCFHERFVHVH